MMRAALIAFLLFGVGALSLLGGCTPNRIGNRLPRSGQEIVVAGQLFNAGTRVVLWTDPNGYDAYRVEKRFAPWAESEWPSLSKDSTFTPNRYGPRKAGLTDAEFERIRGGGWSLDELRAKVDQFVMHYDVAGTSRACFHTLHDDRCLSVHFMLDIDGTIYQTLDVKERAWHATISNDRSVGIEIANIGAYADSEKNPFSRWYTTDEHGTRLTVPARAAGGVLTPSFVGRPSRAEPVVGEINGRKLTQYDLTPEQYAALIKLTAALHAALPKIALDCPRDTNGLPLTRTLTPDEWSSFSGVLGHFHVQANKSDPGPAFDWERVLTGARRLAK